MFTVKVCHSNGTENIFEARRVEYIDQPIMNGEAVDTAPGVLVHYEDGGATHYARDAEDRPQGLRLFIMNRFGSTVGDYRL